MPNSLKYLIAGAVCLMSAGCEKPVATPDTAWAVNVGGDGYVGVDGTEYAPDSSISGGVVATLDAVKGSQDAFLYETYREGDIELAHPMANGIYDITLHFAEPDDVPGGTRVFDTIVEGNTVIDDLDVMASRDGKVRSGLAVTIPGVRIDDGELNIEFRATAEEPILSAVAVRAKKPPGSAWRLTHSDEFDYEGAPRSSMWNADLWPARVVNDEDQAYTNNPRNLRVEDGHLIIEAHKEDFDNAKYTSARIHTLGKVDLLYGRIEVRAKLPRGKGTWPAIWMLPSAPFRYATRCEEGDTWQGSADCDAWPNSGEIDIMEHVGYEMGHVHGTVHNEAYYWAKWEQRKGRIIVDDVDQAFHVYAMEWTPERIDVFLDDTLYFTYVNENEGWRSWPYDHPFHLVINIAVGGQWGRAGGGIDDTIFPQKMLVDYVRFFEWSDPPSGDNQ
jgi:beta-glucanase (GH16 family)